MKEWFFIRDGERTGPFSLDELRGHQVERDTLVWREGLADWVRAADEPELVPLVTRTPPPIPAAREAPPRASSPVEPSVLQQPTTRPPPRAEDGGAVGGQRSPGHQPTGAHLVSQGRQRPVTVKRAFLGSLAAIMLGVVGVIAGANSMVWLLFLGVPMLGITCLVWLAMKLARASSRAAQGVDPDAARASGASSASPKQQVGTAVAAILLIGVLGVVIWYQFNKNALAVQAAANEQARREAEDRAEHEAYVARQAEAIYWVRPGGAYACPSIETITTAWSVSDARGVYAADAYLAGQCSYLPEGIKVQIHGDGSVPVVSTDHGYMAMRSLRH